MGIFWLLRDTEIGKLQIAVEYVFIAIMRNFLKSFVL